MENKIAHYLMSYVDGSNSASSIKKWLKNDGVIVNLKKRIGNSFEVLVDGEIKTITAKYL